MSAFLIGLLFIFGFGFLIGITDKGWLFLLALVLFIALVAGAWIANSFFEALWVALLTLIPLFVGIGLGVNFKDNSSYSSSCSSANKCCPDYLNWDRVYDSLGDNYSHQLADTKEQAIQYHFKADYSKTKRSFDEDVKLRGISDSEKNHLFSFFDKFEQIVEYTEFVECGGNGEFYLRNQHPNGSEWTYHHWPIRYNKEWDTIMRRGEIRMGNTYLRYGLSDRHIFQYWQTYGNGKLVGFEPSRVEL